MKELDRYIARYQNTHRDAYILVNSCRMIVAPVAIIKVMRAYALTVIANHEKDTLRDILLNNRWARTVWAEDTEGTYRNTLLHRANVAYLTCTNMCASKVLDELDNVWEDTSRAYIGARISFLVALDYVAECDILVDIAKLLGWDATIPERYVVPKRHMLRLNGLYHEHKDTLKVDSVTRYTGVRLPHLPLPYWWAK